MKKAILALSFLLLLSGCGVKVTSEAPAAPAESPETAEYHKISPEEAHEMMTNQTVTIVDVRTEKEYAQSHIENAVLVPNETITDEAPQALPDKSATLLVYCRSGRRSKEASDKLLELGYENVYDFGGINDWPYDVVTD